VRRPRIETFDLNLLRTFDSLFQHRSVNAAATEIGVSPSAISHALARLRREFDDELFVKGRGSMIPTAHATELAGSVAAALGHVRALLEPSEFQPEITKRHFKLRCNHYVSWLVLPEIVAYLHQHSPGIRLTVQCDESSGIADDLDTGIVDFVIGTFSHIPSRFESETLLEDNFVWVLRNDHPILQSNATVEDLMKMPQLVVASNEIEQSIDGVLMESGLERPVVNDKIYLEYSKNKSKFTEDIPATVVINSFLVVPSILANSDMVSLLPTRLVDVVSQTYPLVSIDYQRESKFEHKIIWHAKRGIDPAIAWMLSTIRSVISKRGGDT
jgi:DNA-binding transcriptional LysR family regulator